MQYIIEAKYTTFIQMGKLWVAFTAILRKKATTLQHNVKEQEHKI
jgi:hypothetical protein